MHLFFPQWQGSGATDAVYHGAHLLRDFLQPKLDFVEVPVQPFHPLVLEQNIWGQAVLLQQLQQACSILSQHNPSHIFLVSGDCGLEIAPVSFLNHQYNGDLAVIWFDAHADMNTPESSPSKTLHGMPLRTILGEGDTQLVQSMFSTLSPSQVFLVGTREFDPAEERYIQQHNVSVFSPERLAQNIQDLADSIIAADFHNLYIHLDFDVLDPSQFPYTEFPSANGLSIGQLLNVIENLRDAFQVVGFSLLELAPGDDPSLTVLEPLLDLYRSLATR